MRRAVLLIAATVAVAVAAGWLFWSARSPADPERFTGVGSHYSAEITLDNARPGVVEADVLVTGLKDRPRSVEAIWLSAVMPEMGHATPEVPAQQRETGRFQARGELFTMPGVWELAIRVQGTGGTELITVNVLVER
jgi:hypothetical protein